MAGINLLDQLKGKRAGSGTSSSAPTPRAPRFNFSDPSGDSILLVKLLVTALVFSAIYYFGNQYLDQQTSVVQGDLDKVQAQIAKETIKKNQLKGVVEEMKGYQVRVQELEAKIKAVSLKDVNRNFLVKALDYVVTEMPREIWFSEITTTRDEATQASLMTFAGYALNAQAVSEFIQKLELSVYFPATSLERMEIVSDSAAAAVAGSVKIPPSSRHFQVVAKLGE